MEPQVPTQFSQNIQPTTPQTQNNYLIIFLSFVVGLSVGIFSTTFYNSSITKVTYQPTITPTPTTAPITTIPTPTTETITQISTTPAIPTITTKNTTNGIKLINITTDPILGLKNYQLSIPDSFEQLVHSSNFQETETFQNNPSNPEAGIQIIITQEKNLNPKTNKAYTSLKDYLMISYDLDTIVVDGQKGFRVLPRAGSETSNKVVFFSPDNKQIFSIATTSPIDGSKLQEANKIFTETITSFKIGN